MSNTKKNLSDFDIREDENAFNSEDDDEACEINSNHEEDEYGCYEAREEWVDADTVFWSNIMDDFGLCKDAEELMETDLVGKEFETMGDAENFYKLYSKFMGFSIRKQQKRKNRHGVLNIRSWLCSNEGFRKQQDSNAPTRKKEIRGITRTGCLARFRVNLSKYTSKWVVKAFHPNHNHSLANDIEKLFCDLYAIYLKVFVGKQ
ncbi:FHY3/FAR1 family [Parasponia andersonii]|uniref:FHY3/FAR1 family n=1 Tax=Parasponia andersonii TaxID=3476 RepID=A0A2P5AVW4_PARAD|nr:FHY3/FAR1 family [Parasponia andersonii]